MASLSPSPAAAAENTRGCGAPSSLTYGTPCNMPHPAPLWSNPPPRLLYCAFVQQLQSLTCSSLLKTRGCGAPSSPTSGTPCNMPHPAPLWSNPPPRLLYCAFVQQLQSLTCSSLLKTRGCGAPSSPTSGTPWNMPHPAPLWSNPPPRLLYCTFVQQLEPRTCSSLLKTRGCGAPSSPTSGTP
jgi:hypothetical protein